MASSTPWAKGMAMDNWLDEIPSERKVKSLRKCRHVVKVVDMPNKKVRIMRGKSKPLGNIRFGSGT